jgi:hypothetical protein
MQMFINFVKMILRNTNVNLIYCFIVQASWKGHSVGSTAIHNVDLRRGFSSGGG